MKQHFFSRSLPLLCAALIMHANSLLEGACGTTTNWHNLSGCSSDGIITDVFNENIDIIGTNAVSGPIHVGAISCDVLITVTGGDAILTSSARCDAVPQVAPSNLYLYAGAGQKITLSLENSLQFTGTIDGAVEQSLMVTFSGDGRLDILLKGGTSISFEATSSSSGAAYFYVINEGSSNSVHPIVNCRRMAPLGEFGPGEAALDAEFRAGRKSIVSFLAETNALTPAPDTEVGEIIFDPSTTGTGRLIVRISDSGALLTQAKLLLVSSDTDFTTTDIDPTIFAGFSSLLTVDNANSNNNNAWSGLQIVNENQTYPPLNIDPFCNGEFDTLNGAQSGFILGPTGTLTINDLSYVDYIGTTTNACLVFGDPGQEQERLRNPSAFIVDALDNITSTSIVMNGASALYVRSGCEPDGTVQPDYLSSSLTPCAGNITFDVEGPLNIIGDANNNSVFQVLSLQVTISGCPVVVESTETQFPQRTFATNLDNGSYLRYNSAGVLVNNRINLFDVKWMHTDENHTVYERGNLGTTYLSSAPTYIGGDTYTLCNLPSLGRPTIALYNSQLRLHTSACSTGVDWKTPNLQGADNNSSTIFYSNGRCIDDGYGRTLVLGTENCFQNCPTTQDTASHFDIFQENAQASPTAQQMTFLTAFNSSCITENITSPADIAGQFSVHSFFLNNASNLSIGTNGDLGVDRFGNTFVLTTTPTVTINGSFLSFDSHGGSIGYPEASATTGEGGIFVDKQGVLQVGTNNLIVNFGAMVAGSKNGVINLPYNSVHFDNRVGIADWGVDLTDPAQRVLVSADQQYSDYTMDWGAVKKEYCTIDPNTVFIPYDLPTAPTLCFSPAVVAANLRALPEVRGYVDQFQIKRSRIGDIAHLYVNGGQIRELVLLSGYNAAEAPVGFIVLDNYAQVGIGSAHRTEDSLQASVMLGINGVNLVAEGNGTVILNEDIEINNLCHIITGTSFGEGAQETLRLYSPTQRELRVKTGGTLDLSSFTNTNQVLEIGGRIHVILEPGARIIMNGGILRFVDEAVLEPEPVFSEIDPGVTVASTDSFRVKMSGQGTVIFAEGSQMILHKDTYFGIETYSPAEQEPIECPLITNIQFLVQDQARISIGNAEVPGGAFQVGDTGDESESAGVNFNLVLDGPQATLEIDRNGFFGLAAGIIDKRSSIPNEWTLGCLSNVVTASIQINEGIFRHNQIAPTTDAISSVMAVGPIVADGTGYTFLANLTDSTILGGGNLMTFSCNEADAVAAQVTTVADTIEQQNGNFVGTGLMSGKMLLVDANKTNPFIANEASSSVSQLGQINMTRDTFFNYLTTVSAPTQSAPRANFARNQTNITTWGFVDGTTINRFQLTPGTLKSRLGGQTPAQVDSSLAVGAISIDPAQLGYSPTELTGFLSR